VCNPRSSISVNYRIQLCGIIKEGFNEGATLSCYTMMASNGGYGASFPRGYIIFLLRKISESCFQPAVMTFTFLTRNRMGLLQLMRRKDNGTRREVAPTRKKSLGLKVPVARNYAAIPKRYHAKFPLVLRSLPISVQFKKVPARGSRRTPHTIIPLSQLQLRQRRLIKLTTSVITAVIWPSRLQNEIRLLH